MKVQGVMTIDYYIKDNTLLFWVSLYMFLTTALNCYISYNNKN